MRRFYYDTSQSPNIIQMQALKTLVGVNQIVFGSDYPFGAGPGKHLAGLQKAGFTPGEFAAIRRTNGLKILPQFSS